MAGSSADASLQEYVLRTPTEDDEPQQVDFLGTFPMGAPKFHDEDINSTWVLKQTKPVEEKGKKRPFRIPERPKWFLEDRPGHTTHKGQQEGALAGNYFVLYKEGDSFVAMPVEQWVKFKPHYEMENALTLEEAENLMSNRGKAGSRIMQKLKINEATKEEEGATEKQMKTGVDSDGEEDIAVGFTKVRKSADDDDGGGAPDSPEKGEDFDFDEIFDNDDEAMVPEDEAEEKAPEEVKPKGMKAEEDEEEQDLDDTGKGLKKILKKHHADAYEDDDEDDEDQPPVGGENLEEDDDDDDDDIDEDADLDAMATNIEARSAANKRSRTPPVAGVRGKTPPVRGKTPPVGAARAKTPPAAAAQRANKLPPRARAPKHEDDEDVPLAKKIKTAGGGAASSGARRPTPEATAPKPESSGGVSKEAVITLLKQHGKLESSKLLKEFKQRKVLKTPEDQKRFLEIVKEVAKMEKESGSDKKYVVLKRQYL